MAARPVLPADQARCAGARPCPSKAICQRYLAPLPNRGGTMADFSLTDDGRPVRDCKHYLDTAGARALADAARAKPQAHEARRGLCGLVP